MTQDENVLRVMAKSMAEKGWFVEIKASRINEHFTVSEAPKPGWVFNQLGVIDLVVKGQP